MTKCYLHLMSKHKGAGKQHVSAQPWMCIYSKRVTDALSRVKAQCIHIETHLMPRVSLQLPLHGSTVSGSIPDHKCAQRLKYNLEGKLNKNSRIFFFFFKG